MRNCSSPDPKDRKNFEQPVIQTLQMFIGEMGCWLVVGAFALYQRYVSRKAGYEALTATSDQDDTVDSPTLAGDDSSEDSAAPVSNPLKLSEGGRVPLIGSRILLLALPACCDIAGTTLMNVGLLFVAASIYQMTRGALVLFVGLFSVLFLKRRLGAYKWFALFVVVAGVAIVGLAGAIAKDEKATPASLVFSQDLKMTAAQGFELLRREIREKVATPAAVQTIIGVLLIAGAQIFTATQFVLEESIMEHYAMEPIKVVGWEGVFGFVVTVIGMIILHLAVGRTDAGRHGYFDAREGLREITHYRSIAVSSVLIMISIGYVQPHFSKYFHLCSLLTFYTVVSTFSVSPSPAPLVLHPAPPSILAARSSFGSSLWALAGRRSSGYRLLGLPCSCMARFCSMTWFGLR